jgi:hypothetical protein
MIRSVANPPNPHEHLDPEYLYTMHRHPTWKSWLGNPPSWCGIFRRLSQNIPAKMQDEDNIESPRGRILSSGMNEGDRNVPQALDE